MYYTTSIFASLGSNEAARTFSFFPSRHALPFVSCRSKASKVQESKPAAPSKSFSTVLSSSPSPSSSSSSHSGTEFRAFTTFYHHHHREIAVQVTGTRESELPFQSFEPESDHDAKRKRLHVYKNRGRSLFAIYFKNNVFLLETMTFPSKSRF